MLLTVAAVAQSECRLIFNQDFKEQWRKACASAEAAGGLYTTVLSFKTINEQMIYHSTAQGFVAVEFATIFKKMCTIWGLL